ncbi:hypothetical protein TNCV_648621 [Trichonephila clavipes]|uniref:Uncharacterized protein n=1 Tax=Trichonephila clavipes TaxID=2585209 RepID=A0A8X6SJD1_TRICX|nr:hypothetical protein TNCV_648621 [Trichonephila clavipes]
MEGIKNLLHIFNHPRRKPNALIITGNARKKGTVQQRPDSFLEKFTSQPAECNEDDIELSYLNKAELLCVTTKDWAVYRPEQLKVVVVDRVVMEGMGAHEHAEVPQHGMAGIRLMSEVVLDLIDTMNPAGFSIHQ